MAEILIKPQVEDSINVISPKNSKMNLTIDEISLRGVDKYEGITIKDSGIRDKFDISVVGIMDDDGKSIMNPPLSEVLSTNQTLILIGEIEKMDMFKEELP
jgi:voltage-gated potassium channel